MIPVPVDKIEALVALASEPVPKPTPSGEYRGAGPPFDLDRWITDHGLTVAAEKPWGAGRRMVLAVCPFNAGHADGSAVITQSSEGKIGFKCHHNSCEKNHCTKFGNYWSREQLTGRVVGSPGMGTQPNRHRARNSTTGEPTLAMGNGL